MKLKNIKIANYRCFKEAEIDIDDHITLVVGKNGAGKSTILDAVAVSVSTFLLGIDGGVSRSILKDDARYEFHDLNGTIDPQHQFPVTIESIGDCLDRQNVKWIRSLNSESSKTTVKDAGELTGLAKKAQNQIMTGDKSLVLPLISYYGTGRLYAQKKEKKNLKSVPREQIRILDHGASYMPAAQTYGRDANSILREVMNVSERPDDIKQRMDSFYAYMDENNYKEADKVLTEIEAIVGTTDPDIAAARTSLDLEKILGE